MHLKRRTMKLKSKPINENQTDFLVHVKGDTYLKVKVKDDKIVIFKTIVKGE